MRPELVIRAVGLYWPLLALVALAGWLRPGYYLRVGVLLGLCWNLAVLPIVGWYCVEQGWWAFETEGPVVLGMPLELYLGWAVWWGGVLPLLASRLRSVVVQVVLVTVLAAGVDAVAMPQMGPVLRLAENWWWGEALLLGTGLWPGALVVFWTAKRQGLVGRVLVQAGTFSVGLFVLVPCLEAGGWAWLAAFDRPGWMVAGFAVVVAALGALGGAAVWEFVRRGAGTPVPFDPPQRLVTTGVYAWLANPMQVAMTGLLLGWGLWFGLWWLVVLAGLGVVYAEGLARWSEAEDLRARYGEEWLEYRSRVGRWWPGRR